MDPEKIQIAKVMLKKKTKSGVSQFRTQAILQSCTHQDIMVLAQKQTHRSMEHNRKPRNGPTTIWSTNL